METTITLPALPGPGPTPRPAASALRLPVLRAAAVPTLTTSVAAGRLAAGLGRWCERLGDAHGEEPLLLESAQVGPAGRTTGLEVCLVHSSTGASSTLVVEAPLVRAAAGESPLPGEPSVSDGPGRLTRARFLHRVLELLSEVVREGGPHLQISALPEGDAGLALHLKLRWGEASGRIELRLGEDLLAVSRGLPPARCEAGPELHRALPGALELELEFARLALPYPVLSSLGVGDLLLPAAGQTLHQGRLLGPAQICLSPDRVILGSLGPDHFEVEAIASPRPLHLEQDLMSTSPLDAVRIELRLRLGRVPLDLEQLAALSPGVVLPLPYASPTVDLLVGDHELGRGELVELDGQLALRVTARRA